MTNEHTKLYIVAHSWYDGYLIHCVTDDYEIALNVLTSLIIKAMKDHIKALERWDFDFPMHSYKEKYIIEKCELNTFYRYHLRDEV